MTFTLRFLQVLISLFWASNCFAANMVCYDQTTRQVTFKAKSVSVSNHPETNCLRVSHVKIDEINRFYKYTGQGNDKDNYIDHDVKFVEMTQAEKDAILLAEETARKLGEATQVDAFNITAKDAFTAFIKVYNSKVPANQKITKAELIQQIKDDKGL